MENIKINYLFILLVLILRKSQRTCRPIFTLSLFRPGLHLADTHRRKVE